MRCRGNDSCSWSPDDKHCLRLCAWPNRSNHCGMESCISSQILTYMAMPLKIPHRFALLELVDSFGPCHLHASLAGSGSLPRRKMAVPFHKFAAQHARRQLVRLKTQTKPVPSVVIVGGWARFCIFQTLHVMFHQPRYLRYRSLGQCSQSASQCSNRASASIPTG